MPTRVLLTPAQRTPFLRVPEDLDERDIARYYTFSPDDLALIRRRRRAHNRLGFAVQLAFLRFPGFPWEPSISVPPAILAFLASQIEEPPSMLQEYAARDPTRREHLGELQQVYGYRPFTRQVYRELSVWLMPIALSTTQGVALMEALLTQLRARKIVRPALSTLERLGWEARRRAERQIFLTLAGNLLEEQQRQLDALLQTPQDGRWTTLTWLREPPGPAKPSSFLNLATSLRFIRALGLDPLARARVHAARLGQLAREGERYTPQFLARFEPLRRYATLVASLLTTSERLTDKALEMHDRIIGQLFTTARKTHLAQFADQGTSINRTVRLYAHVGKAVIAAREMGRDAFAAIQEVLPWDAYVSSVDAAEQQTRPGDFDYLDLFDDAYPNLRRYVPDLLETFTFSATPTSEAVVSVVDALALLRDLGRKRVPSAAPTAFVRARWRPYVFTNEGINRHYYEMCALTELRGGLRSGDVWIEGSHKYRELEAYLLPREEWAQLQRGLDQGADQTGDQGVGPDRRPGSRSR